MFSSCVYFLKFKTTKVLGNNKLAFQLRGSHWSSSKTDSVIVQVKYFVSPSAVSRRAVVSYWRKYVHEVLVNRLGGLSMPRKSVVRLTDRPNMTLNVYRGRKTTIQQQKQQQVKSRVEAAGDWNTLYLCQPSSFWVLFLNQRKEGDWLRLSYAVLKIQRAYNPHYPYDHLTKGNIYLFTFILLYI